MINFVRLNCVPDKPPDLSPWSLELLCAAAQMMSSSSLQAAIVADSGLLLVGFLSCSSGIIYLALEQSQLREREIKIKIPSLLNKSNGSLAGLSLGLHCRFFRCSTASTGLTSI